MNKHRREKIKKALDILCEVRDEEREAYENLPEGIQYSERGEAMEENADQLEEVTSTLDDILSR